MVESDVIELVERFRSGDQDAATELFHRCSGHMLAVVHRLLGRASNRAALDSEGIVNSGFRSFFSAVNKPHFDSRTKSIGGLLTTIVARKALAKLRRKYPLNFAPEDLMAIKEATTAILDACLTEQEVEADLREKVSQIVATMTEREAKVVELYIKPEEETLKEIAKKCRCSLTSVENTIELFTFKLGELMETDK